MRNNTKNIIIEVTDVDIVLRPNEHEATKEKYPRVHFSDSGMLIDELAYSADQWTSSDLDENNMEAVDESERYAFEHYNMEDEAHENTREVSQLHTIMEALSLETLAKEDVRAIQKSELYAGAWLALNKPKAWAQFLKAYEEKLADERYSYDGSEFMRMHAPGLLKELCAARDSACDDLRREWLHGDYRGYRGVVAEVARAYGAESGEYNDKTGDVYIFEFEPEELHARLCGCYEDMNECEEKWTVKKYKAALMDAIYNNSMSRRNKEKAEREKRKAERERLQQYKKEQSEKAEAERVEKLKGLKK